MEQQGLSGEQRAAVQAQARQRWGEANFADAREGGSYRGDVLQVGRALAQRVGEHSIVLHDATKVSQANDRLAWKQSHDKLTGESLQIHYTPNGEAKSYPFDKAREQVDRMVGAMKKYGKELGLGGAFNAQLDTVVERMIEVRESRESVAAIEAAFAAGDRRKGLDEAYKLTLHDPRTAYATLKRLEPETAFPAAKFRADQHEAVSMAKAVDWKVDSVDRAVVLAKLGDVAIDNPRFALELLKRNGASGEILKPFEQAEALLAKEETAWLQKEERKNGHATPDVGKAAPAQAQAPEQEVKGRAAVRSPDAKSATPKAPRNKAKAAAVDKPAAAEKGRER